MEVTDGLGKNVSEMESKSWLKCFRRSGEEENWTSNSHHQTAYPAFVPVYYLSPVTVSDLSVPLVKANPSVVYLILSSLTYLTYGPGKSPLSYIISYFLSTASFPSAYEHADIFPI